MNGPTLTVLLLIVVLGLQVIPASIFEMMQPAWRMRPLRHRVGHCTFLLAVSSTWICFVISLITYLLTHKHGV